MFPACCALFIALDHFIIRYQLSLIYGIILCKQIVVQEM